MQESREMYRLYAVTAQVMDPMEQVRQAIAGGITMLQIRKKNCTTQELVRFAEPMLMLCRDAGIPCLINDDVQAAKLLGADGVHVGQQDMPLQQAREILGDHKWIGTSAHTVAEAIRAEKEGADYIGCGAVFPSGTKTDATPLSYETLSTICRAVTIPVVAIGGITAKNARLLSGAGVDGIAVVSALFGKSDVRRAAAELRTLSAEICRKEETACNYHRF